MTRVAFLISVAMIPVAAAQPITPFYVWELAPQPGDLSAVPSATDLVNGFAVTTEPGILNDEVINESYYNGLFGIIDFDNEVFSWLMDTNSACLPIIEGLASDGFLPGYGNGPEDFVDGAINGPLDGILRDFGRAALSVRFGFSSPVDIGGIRIIGGNTNDADGRTFHHYDVWASTDGFGDLGTFFPIALGVRTGDFGFINSNLWSGSQTEVHDFDSKYIVQGCTDLRVVFYCVANLDGLFMDPWQGNANEDPNYAIECPDVEDDDLDGRRKAFVGSVIREIDVFPPDAPDDPDPQITPWGDIDYDEDHDLLDFAAFQGCFASSVGTGGCFRFDLDESGDILFNDFETLIPLMAGPD